MGLRSDRFERPQVKSIRCWVCGEMEQPAMLCANAEDICFGCSQDRMNRKSERGRLAMETFDDKVYEALKSINEETNASDDGYEVAKRLGVKPERVWRSLHRLYIQGKATKLGGHAYALSVYHAIEKGQ